MQDSQEHLDDHVLEHEIIYVPIAKTDLSRLVNFLMVKDDSLITENLSKILFRYFRHGD
jgi:hypothetical protein